MAARWSALSAGRTLPTGFFIFKDSWYSFLLEAESTPGPVRPEGLGQFKKSISPELEPATFRLADSALTTTLLDFKISLYFKLILASARNL
jgi:hypothetical protein